jgi:hypothetical protein
METSTRRAQGQIRRTEYSGSSSPSGFHLYKQDFCEEPKLGVTDDAASPMGFEGAGER